MEELLPVLIGMFACGLCPRIGPARFRGAATILLVVFGGALATTINGEWGTGPAALLIDTALVAVGALAVRAGLTILGSVRRRPEARRLL
ncbi:MAG TPA: hypothetical protein VKA46_08945 [Gemmataceae bacterium]|nr:hypothetical protein [Gemmataceae bacterium]